jgi:hypothetical protein
MAGGSDKHRSAGLLVGGLLLGMGVPLTIVGFLTDWRLSVLGVTSFALGLALAAPFDGSAP